jgi:hypothetical protein
MWPWGGRERTQVTPTTEVGIPWRVFWSAWGVGCLLVLVCYLLGWLSTLSQWLEVATFSDWLTKSYLPYIRLAWPELIQWMLIMFFPAALSFYIRLNFEQIFKAWLPWDLGALIRKDKK